MRTELIFLGAIGSLTFASSAAPFATTQEAAYISPTNATLNGMATPNGQASVVWFEWGERGNYGQTTSLTNIGTSSSVVRVSVDISGLTFGRGYQYRMAVSNASGVVYGAKQLFTTGSRVVGWGYLANEYGQATPPPGLSNAVAISAGGQHSLVLKSDRTMLAWGYGGYGQTNVPGQLTNLVAVAAGGNHTLALQADGTVVAWGYNAEGQTNVPTGLSNVVAIAAGWSHSMALKNDGAVVVWGAYQLAAPPGLESNIVAIAAGSSHALALKNDSTVVVWGDNTYGATNLPAGLSNVVAVAGGGYHSVALKQDGTVVAWGYNHWGQTNVPYSLGNVIAIAAGVAESLTLSSNGTLTIWGYYHQATIPTGLGNVVAAAAASHNLALGELAPQAQSQTVLVVSNLDSVISLGAVDPEGDPMTFLISRMPAKGKLYQYGAGGARGIEIVGIGTPVADPQRRVIFDPSTNNFSSPYTTFDFQANDGQLDSTAATVTINIVPPAPWLDAASSRMRTNRQFELNFSGHSNATYRVWRSTNLVTWQVLGTASVTSNGWFQFLDNIGQDHTPSSFRRFYRAGAP